MKVMLIAPPIMDYVGGYLQPIAMDAARESPPYGIYLLSSILKKAGHEVVIADLIAQGSINLEYFYPDLMNCSLVGIGVTSLSWPTAKDVIKGIRQFRPDVPIVLGGIHPTMFDRYILETTSVQFIVRGEGELALPSLCNALELGTDLSGVPNLTWRSYDGQIVRSDLASKIPAEQLSTFPLPDYEALPLNVYKGLAIESSRGCAFDCSFCSTSYRRTWRALPVGDFVDRLEAVMQNLWRTQPLYQTTNIIDDEFSTDPKRATEIAREIRRRDLYPRLVYDSRVSDLVYGGYLEEMADLTCQFLIGAECGYDEGLQKVGKGITCETIENAARKLHKLDLSERADFSFILGLPWETKEEIVRTIRFAANLYSKYGVRVLLQWYCLIPGSRLWDEDRRNELVNETMYDDYGFFRDMYLFRAGVRLIPKEIWEVVDILAKVGWLADMRSPGRRMVQFGVPEPIAKHFPNHLITCTDTGLTSLRQVARPPVEADAVKQQL